MNLTFFTPTLKLSGGNIVMLKYAKYLANKGHFVTIIAPANENSSYIEENVNYRTFKKFSNKYFEHIFFQLIYLNKFFDLTPESDVIIPIFFPLAVHAIYCKKRGKTKKVISLFQDCKEMFWFGNYIYFLLKLKCITNQIDKFIAVSNPIAQQLKNYIGKEVAAIPNGIEHEYFYPRNTEKENYILFIGSSSKMKGLKYFLKAFSLVQKKFSDIKAKIVSPNKIKITIKNIEFINATNDKKKLAELYSKALIYVSQSLGDSFGLPPLEAMACGTAVVLTDTLGSKEYAINKINSMVVPVKNYKKTAEEIVKLIQNVDERHSLEKEGLETAKKYYWEKSFEKFNIEVQYK